MAFKNPLRNLSPDEKLRIGKGYFDARTNPKKYFDDYDMYRQFALSSTKPEARNSYTDQKIMNAWLLSEEPELKEPERERPEPPPRPQFTYDTYYEDPSQFQYLLNENRKRG